MIGVWKVNRKAKTEWSMGRHALSSLLENARDRIIRFHLIQDHPFAKRALELGVPVDYVRREKLNHWLDSDSHQGCAAEIFPEKEYTIGDALDETQHKEKSLFLVLDGIADPQNFGAILRAAEAFGVDAIIWSKHRSVGITPAVRKVSSGAVDLLRLVPVSNIATTLTQLKKEDFSVVVSTLSERSCSLAEFSYPSKSVLVLGSEGEGVKNLTLKLADHHIKIPMQGKMQSLNVSQATSILLYQFAFAR